MATIGTVIDGKYEILKLIGRGGMSKVYLAMDKRLNKQWAVKEISKYARDKNNEVVIQSAIAEANMIKRLDHVALPRIVDILDDKEVIYVVMDYIEGEPLSSVLDEYGAQPQELVIEWAKQLCEVLDYLHTQNPPIIYRDMKPANVMMKPDGNLKLIDFGIAREYKEQNLADTVSLGTKGYAAPEQFGGKGQTDARTDVYCLGVTLYHLVTGQNPCEPPYELYPIRHWNPALSGGLERIIMKCTQLNPDDRYQSCAELLYALNHYEEVDDVYRARQKRKLKTFIATAAASLVCAGVGVTGMVMRSQTNNADYSYNMQLAEKASEDTDKIEYYSSAIEIKPTEMEAYNGLVSAFKNDATFTVEEETEFQKVVKSNLTDLRETEGYADLAYEIGKLYWYYYDYGKSDSGDNQLTRHKSATQWFEDAISYGNETKDYYHIATVYRDIGKFDKEITLSVEEAEDNGMYLPYWNNIKELVTLVENSEETQIVNLELYRLVLYAIEEYVDNFQNDGVEETDIRAVFSNVTNDLQMLAVAGDKTETIKETLIQRIDTIETKISNTYEVKTEEGE